jgi:hypothetical protein
MLQRRNGLVPAIPPESTEHVQTDNWGSPGTWEFLSSPQCIPGWRYRVTNSWPQRRTRPLGSENNERTLRYRQAKATKRGGTGGRTS